jgi:hypothetical protein
MGVAEHSAPFCQSVHMRSDGIGVAAEESDPVVEVVYADHQHVGFIGNLDTFADCCKLKRQQDQRTCGNDFLHRYSHSKETRPI